ncbi:hypothetical protein GGR26_002573 [Lewinella marina]|uniref:Uncharacterized protein n=1 Tax=Neolewinella marina TaxID=438751 RepID=A0A2G0CB54_9BACT|nr:hypothetical protein [Neolewinella marina]NJB86796.1 hypothetical protein [Neolewinella marina]PHK97192.1 hypothetical protein CGL56_17275 [Neolewinella marina]
MALVINNNSSHSLPLFSEHQVLRARDLNNLVSAVFAQLRQNRIFNVGLGIVEGFSVRWDEDRGALVVGRGFGVSSDGYAFDLDECAFTHFRGANSLGVSPEQRVGGCDDYYTLLDKISGGGGNYELGAPGEVVALRENWQRLVPDAAEGAVIPAGRYCLLYLYREAQEARASCFSDCEAAGADQVGQYHAVLVPMEDREDGPEAEVVKIDLPEVPRLPAFGLVEQEIKLCRIRNWEDLYQSYRAACVGIREELALAYGAAARLLNAPGGTQPDAADTALYAATQAVLGRLTEEVYPADPGGECTDIQYLYTYHEDLILAYAAFYRLLQGQTITLGNTEESATGATRCAFSRHLELRTIYFDGESGGRALISDEAEAADPCRTGRILPDNGEERRTLLDEGQQYLVRMQRLVEEGHLFFSTWKREALFDPRITPGDRRFPFLKGNALPFYYHPDVMDDWRVGVQPTIAAYRYVAHSVEHPLLYRPENWDFYRIEGHLGHPLRQNTLGDNPDNLREGGVRARIEELRDCLNLAFDVVDVSLDEPDEEKRLEVITGSDRDNWYKNVRNDILGTLIPLAGGAKTDGSDPDDPALQRCRSVVEFLHAHPHLTTINDWEELKGPVDFCAPLPATLTSQRLDTFVQVYRELVRLLEEMRAKRDSDDPLPYLDLELAECIREAAIEEVRYRESLWRRCYLAGFSRLHPGLVHWGGVPRGGTFVLVHKSSFDREGLIQILRRYTDASSGAFANSSDADLITYARRLQINPESFRRKEVVADFCLPYLCCGAGAVNLQATTPLPPEPLTLEVRTEACTTLKQLLAELGLSVTVNETGGDLTVATADNVEIGNAVRIHTLTQGVAFEGLTPAQLADATLELVATYRKGDRSVNQAFTVSRQPEWIRMNVNFAGRETVDDVRYCRYDLRFEISPSNARVSLDNPPAGVTYDATEQSLRVPEDIAGQIDGLSLIATAGDCTARHTFILPPKPGDDVVAPPAGNTTPPALAIVLNTRRSTREETLEGLGVAETETTVKGEAYGKTQEYVSDSITDVQPDRGLDPALTALTRLHTEEAEQAVFIRKAAMLVATSFLDKLALAGKGEELTDDQEKLMNSLKQTLTALGITGDQVFKNWKVSELYTGIDRKRLGYIGNQLRANEKG